MTDWNLDPDDLWRFRMYDNHAFVSEEECANCGVPLDRVLGWRASAQINPYIIPLLLCEQCTERHRPDLIEFRRLHHLVAERGLELRATGQDDGPVRVVIRPIPPSEGRMTTPVVGTYESPLTLDEVQTWLGQT